MKRIGKKELLIPIIGVAIILAVAFALQGQEVSNSGPANTPFGTPNFQYNSVPASKRVVETSQGIVGEINTASQFQNVTIAIQVLSDNLGGYIQQEVLNYNNNEWNGNWLLSVPTNNATIALLDLRTLISENGQVQSIQIQINDVTNQTGGNQSLVQWSPLSVNLQQTSTQVQQSPFSGAISLLTVIGTDAAYFVVIAVPLYFGILAALFISRRGFAPLMYWVGRMSRPKPPEDKAMAQASPE